MPRTYINLPWLQMTRMNIGAPGTRLWLDIKFRARWYVLLWYRGQSPFMYASDDATPPCHSNNGRWIFGRRAGVRA